MSPIDIFWIFFMIAAIQPILSQKFLEAARRKMILKIEKKRKSRVILLVHRQERMSLLGFPLFKFIDIHDSEEILRAIHMTDPELPIDLILHTPGGLVLASLQIAKALKDHKGKTTVFVPHYAMSGGTLIALAADEIVMCRHSVLGPVDPQMGSLPAASILKVLEQKDRNHIEDQTLIMADQARKAISQVEQSVYHLIQDKFEEEKGREIAKLLSQGTWTHDYPITFEAAKELGLPVSSGMDEEVLELMQLFPEPVKQSPTVEYLPYPYYGPKNHGKDK